MNKLTILSSKHRNNTLFDQMKLLKSIGVWLEGKCSWLNDQSDWDLSPKVRSSFSPVEILVAYHKRWGLELTILQEKSFKEEDNVITVIIKNQTELKKELKLVYHRQLLNQDSSENVIFVSPSEKAIFQHSGSLLTLVSSKFTREKNSECAVGRKDSIWSEAEGALAFTPLCGEGRECMIVTKIELEPWQETFGRIWEITGCSEEEVYHRHFRHQSIDQHSQGIKRTL
ncbi:hypothetical protein [Halalkalibacter krulwichiae]|uniref:Uncharacterized protein n=1 Tax=Halalkalibacter krulwichiae TaxID=199441 RepID=A0A1X9MCU9_9BACI|nr:hypothetical protein [Halalkalibacter krulwichiae]ARK29381.1 hypothetical protein BkAM31D_05685 [Halalkalibacter krulwichiae]